MKCPYRNVTYHHTSDGCMKPAYDKKILQNAAEKNVRIMTMVIAHGY